MLCRVHEHVIVGGSVARSKPNFLSRSRHYDGRVMSCHVMSMDATSGMIGHWNQRKHAFKKNRTFGFPSWFSSFPFFDKKKHKKTSKILCYEVLLVTAVLEEILFYFFLFWLQSEIPEQPVSKWGKKQQHQLAFPGRFGMDKNVRTGWQYITWQRDTLAAYMDMGVLHGPQK